MCWRLIGSQYSKGPEVAFDEPLLDPGWAEIVPSSARHQIQDFINILLAFRVLNNSPFSLAVSLCSFVVTA